MHRAEEVSFSGRSRTMSKVISVFIFMLGITAMAITGLSQNSKQPAETAAAANAKK